MRESPKRWRRRERNRQEEMSQGMDLLLLEKEKGKDWEQKCFGMCRGAQEYVYACF